MKRQLIKTTQEDLIVCDNPDCNFKILNVNKDVNADLSSYLNVACPKCGENLLTERDYKTYLALIKCINFINKWFSWVLIFKRNSKMTKVSVHTHNGVTMTEDK